MKRLFPILLFIASVSLSAQDTVFYNYNGYVAKSASEAYFSRILRRDPIEPERAQVREVNMAGVTLSETNYFPYSKKTLHGLSRRFYNAGLIRWEAFYNQGKLNGELKAYWPDAKLKRDEVYRNDSLIESHCFTRMGRDTTYFPFKTIASFPGGMPALFQYLDKNLGYPEDAKKAKIQGTVVVSFLVDYDGSIKEVKIKKSLYPSLDNEAQRVVQAMPKWQASMVDDEPQRMRTSLPIIFKHADVVKTKKKKGNK